MKEAETLMLEFGRHHGLKSLDALHLGAFRLLSGEDWVFVCADEKLCDIARKCGMNVQNPAKDD